MGFAQTGRAVDKQRIIGVIGVLGHSLAGSIGEIIGGPYDKGFKGIIVVAVVEIAAQIFFVSFFFHRSRFSRFLFWLCRLGCRGGKPPELPAVLVFEACRLLFE